VIAGSPLTSATLAVSLQTTAASIWYFCSVRSTTYRIGLIEFRR
jgi:hypothetical protein